MKNIILIFSILAVTASCNSKETSPEGHNGINYNMSKSEIEKLGFVCRPDKDEVMSETCAHMDMGGDFLGHKTKDYEIYFDKNGRIAIIKAVFADISSLDDYFPMSTKIGKFYKKNEKSSSLMFSQWYGKNNSGLQLMYLEGVSPFFSESIRIQFVSPKFMRTLEARNSK